MIMRLIFFILLLSTNGLGAQTIRTIDLEDLCTSTDEAKNTACNLIVKVYADGFLEGVGKGVLDTYKYDPLVFKTVKDIKMIDSLPRIIRVVETASCIKKVSVNELVATYLSYVRKNPNLRPEHYKKAMTLAIIEKYCQR